MNFYIKLRPNPPNEQQKTGVSFTHYLKLHAYLNQYYPINMFTIQPTTQHQQFPEKKSLLLSMHCIFYPPALLNQRLNVPRFKDCFEDAILFMNQIEKYNKLQIVLSLNKKKTITRLKKCRNSSTFLVCHICCVFNGGAFFLYIFGLTFIFL